MKRRCKNRRANWPAAELHDDDGVDPRTACTRLTPVSDRQNRKRLQLCREVGRALQVALACDCHDPLLNDLDVVSVESQRGAAQLVVTLRHVGPPPGPAVDEIVERLNAIRGFLRAAVAATVNRRRAADLRFVVLRDAGGAS